MLATASENTEPRGMATSKRLLLCVDDEEVGLHIRKVVLESEGYEVLTATNGPESLEIFRQNPIDAVLLDYLMPGMDGGATAREMKRINSQVPVLMLSAYVDIPREVGDIVDGFVTKGGDPLEFLRAVKQLVSSRPSS